MFSDEKIKQYEQIIRNNNVELNNEDELKSILKQMYLYAQIVYEQFKMNNKEIICSL